MPPTGRRRFNLSQADRLHYAREKYEALMANRHLNDLSEPQCFDSALRSFGLWAHEGEGLRAGQDRTGERRAA